MRVWATAELGRTDRPLLQLLTFTRLYLSDGICQPCDCYNYLVVNVSGIVTTTA